jgi:hypothetical protein
MVRDGEVAPDVERRELGAQQVDHIRLGVW